MSTRCFRGKYGALVTSARVVEQGAHDLVRVWNRGALSGELVVRKGDGALVAAQLGLVESTEEAS